ncbi:hypothetical protein [Lacunimicrobium album]
MNILTILFCCSVTFADQLSVQPITVPDKPFKDIEWHFDENTLRAINTIESKDKQILFLLDSLPKENEKARLLTDQQVQLVFACSFFPEEKVIDRLILISDYGNKALGYPSEVALSQMSSPPVDRIVKQMLELKRSSQVRSCTRCLKMIHGQEEFPKFVQELLSRKDLKFSQEVIDSLKMEAAVKRL